MASGSAAGTRPSGDAVHRNIADVITSISSGLKELAHDVHTAELVSAVRRNDGAQVSKWGALCATKAGALDDRTTPHCVGCGPFALCATPLWHAVYHGQRDIVECLLQAGASAEVASRSCPAEGSRSCSIGGQTALHIAVARGSADCVRRLCNLKASPDMQQCFALRSEDDEPEWNDKTGEFEGGLAGWSALQIAASHLVDSTLCSLLLAHGADVDALSSSKPGAADALDAGCREGEELSKLLRPVRGGDDEALECPICLQPLLALTTQWTPCCIRAFHAHCIRGITSCPMCRTALPPG